MHHGDPKNIKNAELQLIIYKHIDSDLYTKDGREGYEYEISSIYKCQYVDMYGFISFWDDFENMYPDELKKLEPENFYLITFKLNKNYFKYSSKYNQFKWIKAKKVTTEMFKKDPFLGLH